MNTHDKYLNCIATAMKNNNSPTKDAFCTVNKIKQKNCEGCPYNIPLEFYLEELAREKIS